MIFGQFWNDHQPQALCIFTFAWWRSTPYMESFFTFSRKCISASAGVIPLNIQWHVIFLRFYISSNIWTLQQFSFDLQNLYVLCSSMIFSSISFVWFGAKQSSLTSSEPHSSERQTDRSHDGITIRWKLLKLGWNVWKLSNIRSIRSQKKGREHQIRFWYWRLDCKALFGRVLVQER